MATYRLLRNNKESGPFSLEDLQKMGLKAYDLVWIDGKSAAWRYPGEVEELKAFSPRVEEQPYDRFFKKQPEEKKAEPVKQEVPDAYTVAPEHEKYIPKKSVFVTMPAKNGHSTTVAKPAVKEEPYTPPAPAAPVAPAAPAAVQQTISVTENPVAAQVKYSQPLDEIKEMYVKTLYDRKQKMARKTFWLQSLKKVAVIFLLIAIGVVAGLLIKSSNNKKLVLASPVTEHAQVPAVNKPLSANDTDGAILQNVTQEVTAGENPVSEPEASGAEPLKQQTSLAKNKNGTVPEKKQPDPVAEDQPGNTAMSPGAAVDPATGERGRRVRGDNNATAPVERERKTFSGNEVSDQVSVKSNDYKKVAFGGIRNLELTVTNDSKYTLDNVVVELQYIKPNELPLRTEKVEFKSIGPKSASTIRLPDTNRGIKVVYRIINIRSSQMDEVATGS